MIHHGDCLDVMATLEAGSVAAIVTDPPYGLGFMGKAWDGTAGPGGLGDMPMRRNAGTNTVNTGVSRQGGRQRSTDDFAKRQARDARSFQEWCETWATAAFRVAKPGAHLLAFGGTRTYHRLASAIEDAGWEIRDCLVWAYASGFPKSHNLTGEWDGWGTALKPAWEPIVMARKPLRGTVAANVLAHGTGALNIDGTRIGLEGGSAGAGAGAGAGAFILHDGLNGPRGDAVPGLGRWPANVILTDPIFDGGIEGVVGGGYQESTSIPGSWAPRGAFPIDNPEPTIYGDSGTYSRFFLIPKADRTDREPVLRTDRELPFDDFNRNVGNTLGKRRLNSHPTVKPVDLMRHLVRLVTPPGGLVLDPFLGSGTTGIACEMEGFDWIGIEREAEYVAIAEARLVGVQKGMGLSA